MDPVTIIEIIVPLFAWLLIGTILFAAYLGLPLRRSERMKLFLELLADGLKRGQSPEQTIVSIARCQDFSLGAEFYLVAAHIESGLRLSQAVAKVPSFLPKEIGAMLRAGEEAGVTDKIVPACQQRLQDARSQTLRRSSFLSPSFCLAPVAALIFAISSQVIFPRLREIVFGMGTELPALTVWIFAHTKALALVFLLWSLFVFWLSLRSAMPATMTRPVRWLHEWFSMRLRWRRTRLQRDFSAVLALMLDAGIPEEKAVLLAASATDNRFFTRRALRVGQKLEYGEKLSEAVALLDETGEFHWRLKNALHQRGSFLQALNGWLEALDARAFQQQQSAIHLSMSFIIAINGMLIGLVVTGVFQVLITIIDAEVLW